MILLTYEEHNHRTKTTKRKIAEMFDTAKEFKEYIIQYLKDTEKGLNEDNEGLTNGLLFSNAQIEDVSFERQLEQFLEFTEFEVEVK